jgi:hypothetical protein
MRLNIRALSKALIKSMTTIAKTPDRYKDVNVGKAVDEEVDKMLKNYTKNVGEDSNLKNEKATKENE